MRSFSFNITIDHAATHASSTFDDTTDDASLAARDGSEWGSHVTGPSPPPPPSEIASYARPATGYLSQAPTADPSYAQPTTYYPYYQQPATYYPSYAQPATNYPYYVQPTATYPSYSQPATNYPYYVQPAATYPSYSTNYPYYVQPSGIYPPYARAGPGYLPSAQYLSSYPPYTQSVPGYSNDLKRPLEERQPGHEGIQRRDTLTLGHSKPNRLLRFSILLRSNKKVVEDEESSLYKGEYPLLGDSRRLWHSTKENAKHFDIVSTQCLPAEDGCQSISLVLMDEMAMRSPTNVRCESHWRYLHVKLRNHRRLIGGTRHLNHDILSFEQLYVRNQSYPRSWNRD